MKLRLGRYVFALVAVGVALATLFRVATAPERVQKIRDSARSSCGASGGTWKVVDDQERCEKP